LENLKEGDQSEDLDTYGRRILEWILEEYDGRLWSGFVYLRTGASGGIF
jgi:hypothetical protein